MSSRILLIAAGALVIAGCNTTRKNIGQEDPGLGEAVKYDAAVQIINPEPVYQAGAAQPGDSGVKGAAAVKRYRTDAVKQVESMQTTSGSSSGPR
ncbi:MAG TPA: hypothetical protein VF067_03265 [Sphingomicrobium sp.]